MAAASLVAGALAAPGSARGGGCSTDPKSSTPFKAFGDSTPYVAAPVENNSLADGQSLTTDCVKLLRSQAVVRFFARSTSGGGQLHVELLVSGTGRVLDAGLVSAPDTMGPVDQLVIAPGELKRGALGLQVRLTAVGGSFEVGDVFIDPYVQR